MKGIAIIAMIVGHCPIPHKIWLFIYAWHMPLFFIVSGYFFKKKESIKSSFKSNFRQLIIPYIFVCAISLLITGIRQLTIGKGDVIHVLISSMIGNGSANNPTFSDYRIGAIWFLPAMFWCRIIYNSIYLKYNNDYIKLGGVIVFFSVIATYIGLKVFVPTDLIQGLEALLFFHIGHLMKVHNIFNRSYTYQHTIIAILLIALSMLSGSMSMVRCYYGFWPINYLAAIFATIMIYQLSKRMHSRSLAYCGRVSLVLLCAHNLIISNIFLFISDMHSRIIRTIIIMVFSFVLTYLFMQIKYLRRIVFNQ